MKFLIIEACTLKVKITRLGPLISSLDECYFINTQKRSFTFEWPSLVVIKKKFCYLKRATISVYFDKLSF